MNSTTKSAETLMTAQWRVVLADHERAVYAKMRELEESFMYACEIYGCTVITSKRRQSLVLVPKSVKPPSISERIYEDWSDILHRAALRQDKRLTIGTRSSQPPRWFDNGTWVTQRPTAVATRVTSRTQSAHRGAQIEANEAISYLVGRIVDLKSSISNSCRAGQKSRAQEQGERLEIMQIYLNDVLAACERARDEGKKISAQISSGKAWKLHANFDDGSAHTFSVPSVGLLSVADNVVVSEAEKRRREVDAEVIDAGPIQLRLYY